MPENKQISRRSFLQRAGTAARLATASVLAAPAIAKAADLRKVTMRLDWLFQGPNDGFIIAQTKGFYKAVGLDVDIGPGKGSGSTAQLVASKATEFGFSDGYVVGNSVSKGLNIRMVASIYRRNPAAVVVLDESVIKSPKDLEGKTVGIPTGSAQFQQWPAFLRGCNLDPGKIRVVNIDPAGSPPALINHQVDAIAGFAQGYVPSVEYRGQKDARVLWYADCGVNAVSNGIIVHNDLINAEPKLISDFVAASAKGFLYGRQHPDEAAQIIRQYSEATVPAISKREMELSWKTWVTPNTTGRPLGWMSDKDWESTVDVLKTYGGVTGPLEASQLYTNAFVPSGAEYIPPQT
jgi:NitT/TauT family transport system substrate-binding protein